MSKAWFITGTSSGLGLALTKRLLERGDRVVATLRRPHLLVNLVEQYGNQLWVQQLDVTDTRQLREVVNDVFADLDRIDVVVSNAGYGVFGAAEELTDEQIDSMLATNLTASIQLARAVTPHLRSQGGGIILQLSSMGGLIGVPNFSLYHTTKWGIEGFYEAFAPEVEPFGIRTILIEPGMIRTPFFVAAQHAPRHEAYLDHPAIAENPPVESMPGDQAKVVAATIAAADSDNPPRRLLLGSDAYVRVSGALTDRLRCFEMHRDTAFSTDYDDFRISGSSARAVPPSA